MFLDMSNWLTTTIIGCIGSSNVAPCMKPNPTKYTIIDKSRFRIESYGLGAKWVVIIIASCYSNW